MAVNTKSLIPDQLNRNLHGGIQGWSRLRTTALPALFLPGLIGFFNKLSSLRVKMSSYCGLDCPLLQSYQELLPWFPGPHLTNLDAMETLQASPSLRDSSDLPPKSSAFLPDTLVFPGFCFWFSLSFPTLPGHLHWWPGRTA